MRGSFFACIFALAACTASQNEAGDLGAGAKDAQPDATPEAAADAAVEAEAAAPTLAEELLALTAKCNVASTAQYSIHQGSPPSIDVCRLNGAFFWSSSMNVDCDGQTTTECNSSTDPSYQNQTSFNQSDGKPLIASELPYVVIPLPSARWDYKASGVMPGAVVAVLYGGALTFGVFGDEGPANLIGEASYAMAKSVGVDPDPANGGVDNGATYIVFVGAGAVVKPIEDHAAALALGSELAMALVKNN